MDPVWVTFHSFRADKHNGVHNLGSNTLKAMLSSTLPNSSTHDEKADLTEVSAGSGYTAGGITLSSVTSTQSGGVYTFNCATFSWTASGGSIGPFRSVVIYNDTSSGKKLICHLTFDDALLTIPDGNTFEVPVSATTGIFQTKDNEDA